MYTHAELHKFLIHKIHKCLNNFFHSTPKTKRIPTIYEEVRFKELCLCPINTYWTLQISQTLQAEQTFLFLFHINFSHYISYHSYSKKPSFLKYGISERNQQSSCRKLNYFELTVHPVFNSCCHPSIKNLKKQVGASVILSTI